jgi:TRAP-type C4-dicarboxylate transport system permease small subunit
MRHSTKRSVYRETISGRLRARLDGLLGATVRVMAILVLPLALLLFLQWPLREIVQAYSRETNDIAQILFALYVGLAITAATRENGHIAADALARRFRERTRLSLKRIASLVILMPWSIFMLWAAWPEVWRSIRDFEGFPETYNPGYFVLKTAVVLLALAVLIQSLIDAFRRPPGDER